MTVPQPVLCRSCIVEDKSIGPATPPDPTRCAGCGATLKGE